MVKSGRGVENYRAFVAPVYIIEATIEAFECEKEVEVIIPDINVY